MLGKGAESQESIKIYPHEAFKYKGLLNTSVEKVLESL